MNPSHKRSWLLFGIIITLIVAFIAYQFIGAVVAGIFVYYSTRPTYTFLRHHNIGRTTAALFSPLVFIIPVLFLLAYTARVIAIELQALAGSTQFSLDGILTELVSRSVIRELPNPNGIEEFSINNIQQRFSNNTISPNLVTDVTSSIDSIFTILTQLSDVVLTVFIILAVTFYLLRDDDKISGNFLSLLNYDSVATDYFDQLDRHLQTVFFGNILVAVISGLIGALAFSILSQFVPGGDVLPYPALIGLLCGVGSLIPIIGMKVIYVPVTGLILLTNVAKLPTFGEALLFPLVFFSVALVIVDTVPDLLVRPYVSSRGGVSTGLLLFSYTLGPLVFGWYGLFLGPLLFVVFSDFYDVVAPRIASR